MKKLFLGSMVLIIMTIASYAETKKYYNTGELKFVFPTKVNGKLEGKVTEYYRDGNVKYQWNYKNGIKEGICKKYEDGHLKFTWFYTNGQRGITTKEYYKSGQLKYKWKYQNDKLHGVSKQFYKDGKLKATLQYRHGRLIP